MDVLHLQERFRAVFRALGHEDWVGGGRVWVARWWRWIGVRVEGVDGAVTLDYSRVGGEACSGKILQRGGGETRPREGLTVERQSCAATRLLVRQFAGKRGRTAGVQLGRRAPAASCGNSRTPRQPNDGPERRPAASAALVQQQKPTGGCATPCYPG
eukprot:COSAG02_NODE_5608_length_4191_cov_3.152493_2_plen_157_part_00